MSGSRLRYWVTHVVLFAFTALVAMPDQARVELAQRPAKPQPTTRLVVATTPPPPAPPPPPAVPSDADSSLEQLRREASDLDGTTSSQAALAQVAALRQRIEAIDEQETKAFAAVEQHLIAAKLPAELLERHAQAVAGFEARIVALHAALNRVEDARSGGARRRTLAEFSELIAPKQRPASRIDPEQLPHRTPTPETREPHLEPTGFLAPDELRTAALRVGQNPPPAPADVAATDGVSLSEPIQELAAELNYEPVAIFNWVHDNIRYLPTYGAVQGAELTLTMRRGNAFDTTSLLIALLRASGIPSRFVQGTVEIPVDAVRNWLGGVPSADAAQSLLGQGGVPTVALIQNGRVTHLRVEHVWAEAFVDFEPSRGAVHRQGDAWIPMDASFKQHQVRPAVDLAATIPGVDFAQLARDVSDTTVINPDGGVTSLYPAYMTQQIAELAALAQEHMEATNPNLTPGDVLGESSINPRTLSTLAAGLPNRVLTRGPARASLPANVRHLVGLKLYASSLDRAVDLPSLSYQVSLPVLSGRRLSVTYAPASAADAQLLQSYVAANAPSFPAYLVRVVPTVQLDGVTVAQGGVTTMGEDHIWDLTLSGPGGGGTDSYTVTSGDYMVFGIDGNGITQALPSARLAAVPSNTVLENLHQVALHYWMEHDLFDDHTAAARGVFQQRAPSAGLFSFPLGVTYLFGLPRSGSYSVELMDVKRVLTSVWAPTDQERFDYVSQTGLQGSYLEGSVFDQLFSRFPGKSDSTAQVLLDAAAAEIPIYTIDSSNVSATLPLVSISADARSEIANAVASGKRVVVPQRPPGEVSGYIIQDTTTGAAAYMIEGGLAGGRGQKCQPASEPQPESLLDRLLKYLLVAFVIAVLIGISIASGGTLAPQAAAVLIIVGAALFLDAGNAYAAVGTRSACCTVLPVPHRGGDAFHNMCADLIGPNDHPGMDAQVDGKAFDAVTGNAVLWEVKTHNLANCTNDFCRDKLLPKWVAEAQSTVAIEAAIAGACGYAYSFGVGDAGFAALVGYPNTVIRPDICLRP